MKVCTNKKCEHKGVRQPKENFYINMRYADNREGECITCKRIKQKRLVVKKREDREFFQKMFL